MWSGKLSEFNALRQGTFLTSILVALTIVLVLSACVRVTSLAMAPASDFPVVVTFEGGLAAASQVHFMVDVFLDGATIIRFTDRQHLRVNGVEAPQREPGLQQQLLSREVTIQRQPPAGAYRFVYIDEQGHQTTAVVPAPQVDLAITEPAAGAHPKTGTGTPAPTPTPYPGAQRQTGQTLTVGYTVPFPPASVPVDGSHSSHYGVSAQATGSCKEPSQTFCGSCTAPDQPSCLAIYGGTNLLVVGGANLAHAAVDLTDAFAHPGSGFENLAPGPGAIQLDMEVRGWLPASGFHFFGVAFLDTISSPVTWIES